MINKKVVWGMVVHAAILAIGFFVFIHFQTAGASDWWELIVVILIGISAAVFKYLHSRYPKEYDEANRIAFTNRTTPGTYIGLLLAIITVVAILYFVIT